MILEAPGSGRHPLELVLGIWVIVGARFDDFGDRCDFDSEPGAKKYAFF